MNPTIHDFGDGNGSVPAHRHQNLNGSIGGWVAETASVETTVFVGKNARVYGDAKVYGDAQVYGYAQVCGNAWVYGNAWVGGENPREKLVKIDFSKLSEDQIARVLVIVTEK